MHCTTSLNDVSAIAERSTRSRAASTRWSSSATRSSGGCTAHRRTAAGAPRTGRHLLEDEYVHLGADTLLALARYLRWDARLSVLRRQRRPRSMRRSTRCWPATSTATGSSSRRSASATRASTSGARRGATCCRSAGRTPGPTPCSTRPGRSSTRCCPRYGRDALASDDPARGPSARRRPTSRVRRPRPGSRRRMALGRRRPARLRLPPGQQQRRRQRRDRRSGTRRAMESVWAELAVAGFERLAPRRAVQRPPRPRR